jgi:hypothetical protein
VLASFHLQLGNLPDWVGAIGTIAVFTVTAFVVIRDQGARREEKSTAAYDAARAVTVAVGPVGRQGPRGSNPYGAREVVTVPLVTVTNGGSRTIYNVVANLYTASELSLGSQTWAELPPESFVTHEGEPHDDMWSKTGPAMLDVLATVTFADAGKTEWYRDTRGNIRRVEQEANRQVSR